MTKEQQIEKLRDTIGMLERVRDRLLDDGQGPFMSDDIFNTIDSLYNDLLNIMNQK